MSFLEYVGLESLLNEDHSGGSILGLGLFILGLFGWGILAIIKSQVLDQSVMVFNLIAFIVLLFHIFKKMIQALKEKKINRIFVIASTVSIIIAFIFGFTFNYHSIIFNYEYNHICSGIAFTFIPVVIINLLFPFFEQKKENLLERFKYSLGSIGHTIIIILMFLCISQIVTIPIALLGKESIYDNFATYHNISYNEKRKEMGNKTVDEFLQENYFKVKDIFRERCINDNNSDCDKFIRDNYVRWLNEYIKKPYGYDIYYAKLLSDSEAIIKVVDREYNKDDYNYKLNMNDFSLSKITHEEFDKIYNSNN